MSIGLASRGKAAAYATAIHLAIGSSPIVEETPNYIRIRFSPEQRKQLQNFIEAQMKKGQGDVRVELAPVLMPIFLKRLLPLAGATIAGLFWFTRGKPTGAMA